MKDPDEVGDGEHAHELLLLRVPQGRGADAVVDQREEGLLDQQLSVENDLKRYKMFRWSFRLSNFNTNDVWFELIVKTRVVNT